MAPDPSPPEGLTFVLVGAVNDQFHASTNQAVIDVLTNDTFGAAPRIVSVEQPEVGSVTISSEQQLLVVDIPQSYAGDVTFAYTFRDESGAEATAVVTVTSANVLGAVREITETRPAPSSVAEGVDLVISRLIALVEIRLSSLELTALASAPVLLGLLWALFSRRERLLSVTNIVARSAVDLTESAGSSSLAHDALVWSTGPSRKWGKSKKVYVETSAGTRGWVRADFLHDTGF